MALPVALSGSDAPYMAVRTASRYSGFPSDRGTTFSTSISGSVMVPVLSTHSTSTRASVSMQFMSCTSTFFRLSFTADAAMAMEVSRYSPSGIIPTSAATVPSTLLSRPSLRTQNS